MRAASNRALPRRAQGAASSQPSRPTAAINRAAAAGSVIHRAGAFPALSIPAPSILVTRIMLGDNGAAASLPSFQGARGAASTAAIETCTANRPRFIPAGDFRCGVEQSGQLAGFIPRRSSVRVRPPLFLSDRLSSEQSGLQPLTASTATGEVVPLKSSRSRLLNINAARSRRASANRASGRRIQRLPDQTSQGRGPGPGARRGPSIPAATWTLADIRRAIRRRRRVLREMDEWHRQRQLPPLESSASTPSTSPGGQERPSQRASRGIHAGTRPDGHNARSSSSVAAASGSSPRGRRDQPATNRAATSRRPASRPGLKCARRALQRGRAQRAASALPPVPSAGQRRAGRSFAAKVRSRSCRDCTPPNGTRRR